MSIYFTSILFIFIDCSIVWMFHSRKLNIPLTHFNPVLCFISFVLQRKTSDWFLYHMQIKEYSQDIYRLISTRLATALNFSLKPTPSINIQQMLHGQSLQCQFFILDLNKSTDEKFSCLIGSILQRWAAL